MKQTSAFQVFAPTWVINLVGITVGIITTGLVIVSSKYWGSDLRRQIFETQDSVQASSVSTSYQDVAANFANNSFLGQLPLLFTWACVGLIVYFFAIAIARSFGRAVTLREELTFVNASREDTIRRAWQSLAIRVAATVGWLVFIRITLVIIVPYALAAANAAATGWTIQNVGLALLAVLILYADVYIHALFLRIILLRTRVFSN